MLKGEIPTAITTCESPIHRQMEAPGCVKCLGNLCGFVVLNKPVFLSPRRWTGLKMTMGQETEVKGMDSVSILAYYDK